MIAIIIDRYENLYSPETMQLYDCTTVDVMADRQWLQYRGAVSGAHSPSHCVYNTIPTCLKLDIVTTMTLMISVLQSRVTCIHCYSI